MVNLETDEGSAQTRGDGWRLIEDAPLRVNGHVWCAELAERTDIIGSVVEYGSGRRAVTSTARGYKFTHWMPLPPPPRVETGLPFGYDPKEGPTNTADMSGERFDGARSASGVNCGVFSGRLAGDPRPGDQVGDGIVHDPRLAHLDQLSIAAPALPTTHLGWRQPNAQAKDEPQS